MEYHRNYSPSHFEILVVGEANSSYDLISSILDIGEFTRLAHVNKIQDAVILLIDNPFSVVILDNDDPSIDVPNFSQIIRINHPVTRILVVSKGYSVELLKDLVNKGSIDGFIPYPIDKITAYTLLLEQHAKHSIIMALRNLVQNPPQFSPAYYVLHDPSIMTLDPETPYSFIGCIISYDDTIKYRVFSKEFVTDNPLLFSVYVNSITILGEQLLQSTTKLNEINLEGTSVVFDFDDDMQISIVLQNVNSFNYKNAEKLVDELILKIKDNYYREITQNRSIEEEVEDSLKSMVLRIVRKHQSPTSINFEDELALIGLHGVEVIEKFDFHTNCSCEIVEMTESEAETAARKQEIDLLVVSPILNHSINKIPLVIKLKDISPKLQIVGFQEYTSPHIFTIVKTGVIDLLLSQGDTIDNYKHDIHRLIQQSKLIKHRSYIPTPLNLRYSMNHEFMIKSLFRMNPDFFGNKGSPILYGVFVIRFDQVFYTKIWENSANVENFDVNAFINISSSLETFSQEVLSETQFISALKYGQYSLIIKRIFDIDFILFTRDISHYNYFLIYEDINRACVNLYNIMSVANIPEAWTQDVHFEVEQILNELFLEFSDIPIVEQSRNKLRELPPKKG